MRASSHTWPGLVRAHLPGTESWEDRGIIHRSPRAAGQGRVVLDATAFIKGWPIATTLWVGVLLTVALIAVGVPTVLSGSDAGYLWGAGLSLAFYGYGIALVFAAPLGWVLAYLLRPIQRQWIHVTAFFVVPTIVFWVVAGLIGFG